MRELVKNKCNSIKVLAILLLLKQLMNFTGWWRHQPGQPEVGVVLTAHKQHSNLKALTFY